MRTNKNEKEIISIAPTRLLQQNEDAIFQREQMQDDFVYMTTERHMEYGEASLLREAMIRGYVEMSQINLNIAAECLYAEFEAQHTVERCVSGG
ncbi:transcriptional regulator [Mammaliicoccus sciuri]|uniref:CopG family transcriptional regulator / antitoxin EndoAI n=1 Tax=Sporosarcina newyorkensis TaxID=759851 RepID=A0A1T4YNB3_9BACL|nr:MULTISPECIES: transcriptional regulator [Sporosarcina]SKB03210.1 CopG family transcriptional regulator / antitoxin EndoAI [Sporosarcina newyorkensis]